MKPIHSPSLRSSSSIFCTKRLHQQDKERIDANQFQQQFPLIESEEIASPNGSQPRQITAPLLIDKMIFGLSELKKQVSDSGEGHLNKRNTDLGQEEEKFLRQVLFQHGYLTWDEHQLELQQLLKLLELKMRSTHKGLPTRQGQLSEMQVNDFEQPIKKVKIVFPTHEKTGKVKVNHRYSQSEQPHLQGEQECRINNGEQFPKQKGINLESNFSFEQLILKKDEKCESALMKYKFSFDEENLFSGKGEGSKKRKVVRNRLSRLLSAIRLPEKQKDEESVFSVEEVGKDSIQGRIGDVKMELKFRRISKMLLKQDSIALEIHSGQSIALMFSDKAKEKELISFIFAWAGDK